MSSLSLNLFPDGDDHHCYNTYCKIKHLIQRLDSLYQQLTGSLEVKLWPRSPFGKTLGGLCICMMHHQSPTDIVKL